MGNHFVGVGQSGVKTARGDLPRLLKLTNVGLIDGTELENTWLVAGVHYWLVVLSHDAMVGVRLAPWLDPNERAWRSTPTPREMAIWIGKTDPLLLRERPLTLEVAHIKIG